MTILPGAISSINTPHNFEHFEEPRIRGLELREGAPRRAESIKDERTRKLQPTARDNFRECQNDCTCARAAALSSFKLAS